MFEYEIKSYIDYDILYNNLMQPTEEKKINNTQNDSTKRENLITQMLMDNYQLEINKDHKFENWRKLYFYIISYFNANDPNKAIKTVRVLKTKANQDYIFDVNGIKYNINFQTKNALVKRIISEDNCCRKITPPPPQPPHPLPHPPPGNIKILYFEKQRKISL